MSSVCKQMYCNDTNSYLYNYFLFTLYYFIKVNTAQKQLSNPSQFFQPVLNVFLIWEGYLRECESPALKTHYQWGLLPYFCSYKPTLVKIYDVASETKHRFLSVKSIERAAIKYI